MVPGIGTVANGISTVWYAAEGDYVSAALSAASMIPGAGTVIKGGALALKATPIALKVSSGLVKAAPKLTSALAKTTSKAMPVLLAGTKKLTGAVSSIAGKAKGVVSSVKNAFVAGLNQVKSKAQRISNSTITKSKELITAAKTKLSSEAGYLNLSSKQTTSTKPPINTNQTGQVIRDGSHIENGVLKPNITYQTGEHNYIYTTNENGLISRVQANDLKLKTHDGRLRHNPNTPGKQEGDHAGHLIADRFGGSPELDNLVSQLQSVNQSSYRKLEDKWASALRKGSHIEVDIRIEYSSSARPDTFDITYTIDGDIYNKQIIN